MGMISAQDSHLDIQIDHEARGEDALHENAHAQPDHLEPDQIIEVNRAALLAGPAYRAHLRAGPEHGRGALEEEVGDEKVREHLHVEGGLHARGGGGPRDRGEAALALEQVVDAGVPRPRGDVRRGAADAADGAHVALLEREARRRVGGGRAAVHLGDDGGAEGFVAAHDEDGGAELGEADCDARADALCPSEDDDVCACELEGGCECVVVDHG